MRAVAALIASVLVVFGGVSSAFMFPNPGPGNQALLGAGGGGGGGGGGSGTFTALAASAMAAEDLPTVWVQQPVDTTGWAVYDVTCVDGGTCPAGSPAPGTVAIPGWGCGVMTNDESTDNSAVLECFHRSMPANALLYFKNGTYDFRTGVDGVNVFRPRNFYDNRGIVCEDNQLTFLQLHSSDVDLTATAFVEEQVAFMEGESEGGGVGETYAEPSPRAWGGNSRGATAITGITGGTAGIVVGEYVHLFADPLPYQDTAQRSWYATVVSVDSASQITIAQPLPDDFGSTNAGVQRFDPQENFVLRNCKIGYANPGHQGGLASWIAIWKNMAHFEVTGNRFVNGYRQFIGFQWTADGYIARNITDGHEWDKGSNGFAVQFTNDSRSMFIDNYIEGMTGIAFSSGSAEVSVLFNRLRRPQGPAYYDAFCTENTADGGGNDCDIATAMAAHAAAHGPTYACTDVSPADGQCDYAPLYTAVYFHCTDASQGPAQEQDALGARGSASCHGSEANGVYSGFEFHNETCVGCTIALNDLDGQMWFDNVNGPGRWAHFYGNFFRGDTPGTGGTPGSPGDMHFRDLGPNTAMMVNQPGYEMNNIWAANVFEGEFGGGLGYNAHGEGARVLHNLIQGGCRDADEAPGENPDGGACTNIGVPVDGGVPRTNAYAHNGVWTNNEVSAATTHPSLPSSPALPSIPGGFTDWPAWGFTPTGTPPFGVGVWNDGVSDPCLPASQRFGEC